MIDRINERRLAESGKSKPDTVDMSEEKNLVALEAMYPGSVDFGGDS